MSERPVSEQERLDRVYRLWSGTSRLWMRRSWWEALHPQTSAFLLQALCVLPVMIADLAFWPMPWVLWEDGRQQVFASGVARFLRQAWSEETVLATVLLVWLGSSALVARLLARKAEPPLRGWALALWSTLAGIPPLPEFVLARWRMASSSADEPLRPLSLDLEPDRPRRWLRSLGRIVDAGMRYAESSYVWALWLSAGNAVVLMLLAARLGDPAPHRFGSASVLVLMTWLHLLGFVGAWTAIPPDRAWPGRLLAFAWLLPTPAPLAPFVSMLFREVEAPRGKTLVHAAWIRRRSVAELPAWLGLRRDLREEWRNLPWWRTLLRPPGLEEKPGVRREDLELFRAARAKAGSLLADGFVLGWGLTSLSRALVSGLLWVAMIWLVAGLTLWAVHLLVVLARSQERVRAFEGLSSARFLVQGGFALGVGLSAGSGLGQGQALLSGMLLVYAYALAAICSALLVMVTKAVPLVGLDPRSGLEVWQGALESFALMLFGGGLAMAGSGLSTRSLLLAACVPLLWGLLLAVGKGGWLLRPFGWRDPLSPELPRRTRLTLGFLALTLAVPLGGLAVAVWPFARRRLAGGGG